MLRSIQKVLFLLSLFLVSNLYAQGTNDNIPQKTPIINTSSGKVQGIVEGDVSVFKGIPFAVPPVGEFRWRPPQPVKAWDGVRDAGEFGPNCAQGGWGTAPRSIQQGSSEDCLYLDLWAPIDANDNAKLPVMVWIHGGGFTGGSGSSPQTFGNHFAQQGVILVTFNYRLGRLGFFAHPALRKEHPEEPKGNYGYMDQIAVLKWVQKSISAFSGDPNNITIFGFSAGGVSVHSLMNIPAAQGLFQKAIATTQFALLVI